MKILSKKNILPFIYILFAILMTVVTILINKSFLSYEVFLPYVFAILIILGIFLNSLRIKFGMLSFSAASVIYLFVTIPLALWGEVIINAFLVLYFFVSFFLIKKTRFEIESSGRKNMLPFFGFIIFLISVYSLLLFFLNSQLPVLNAISNVILVVQTIFISKRFYEQYFFSIMLTACQIALWSIMVFNDESLANLPILLMNIFFLFIHSYNLFAWRKKYLEKNTNK